MRVRLLVAIVLGCVALWPSPSRAADASTAWMTNPRHDGELTDSPLRPPLTVHWDVRLGTVYSNVVVADGRVIFVRMDAANAPQLTALDAASGAHLWSVATPASRIAYEAGRVFATQGTGVAAFSAQTGARLWTQDLQAEYGVPHLVADGGVVYRSWTSPDRAWPRCARTAAPSCGNRRRCRPARARPRSTVTACTSASAAARPTGSAARPGR